MDTGLKEKVAAFDRKQGSECYSDGEFLYFRTGAYREIDPRGLWAEPPNTTTEEGEYEKAKNILKFFQLRLKAAVTEFDELNTRLAYTLPMNPEAEIEKLKDLAGVVETRKSELVKAETALENTRIGKARKLFLQARIEELERIERFQKQRRAIRI